jgi:hypothetical protein
MAYLSALVAAKVIKMHKTCISATKLATCSTTLPHHHEVLPNMPQSCVKQALQIGGGLMTPPSCLIS